MMVKLWLVTTLLLMIARAQVVVPLPQTFPYTVSETNAVVIRTTSLQRYLTEETVENEQQEW